MEKFPQSESQENNNKKESFAEKLLHKKGLSVAIGVLTAIGLNYSSLKEIYDGFEKHKALGIESYEPNNVNEDQVEALAHLTSGVSSIKIKPKQNTIVHIRQAHRRGTLEQTEKEWEAEEGGLKQLIETQKEIEAIILECKEKGGVQYVYSEGVSQQDFNFLSKTKKQFNDIEKEWQAGTLEAQERMYTCWLMMEIATDDVKFNITNSLYHNQAFHAYFIEATLDYLKKVDIEIDEQLKNHEEVGTLKGKYSHLFTEGKVTAESSSNKYPDIETVHEFHHTLKKTIKELSDHPLVANEKSYVWGAAEKLYMENKIEILPFEQRNGTNPFESQMKQITDVRENDFLKHVEVHTDPSKLRIFAVVLGANHDFKDNIEANKDTAGNSGLIEITPPQLILHQPIK